MQAKLIRLESSPEVTLGVLLLDGRVFCQTLELPWKNNAKSISCIPEGNYVCKRVDSPKFGNTFEIQNVPDRDDVLLHQGNFVRDSRGCIIVGGGFNVTTTPTSITGGTSRTTFKLLLNVTRNIDEFNFKIVNIYNII